VLDPVGERRSRGRQERTEADDRVIACGEPEQRPWFPRCIA
jgi:hypothetical protein